LNLLKNNEISKNRWDLLFLKNIFSSPFQSYSFYNLFNSISGLSADVFAIEEAFQIKALCVVTIQKEPGILGFFSRRAIIYGGPIVEPNSELFLDYLLTSINVEIKKKVIYSEIRNLSDYSVFREIYKRNLWQYLPYQNFIVDCADKDKLLQKLSSNRKRQIKKAISNGVKLKEAENITEVIEFYNILKKLYTLKVKKPLLPRNFFEEFFKRDIGKYLLVVFKDSVIGGIMCPIIEGRCIYEYYVAGLDDEYRDLFPSVMATWSAIDYANKNKIPLFDFMGAGNKEEAYGVRDFKARFGGKQIEYGRFLKINNLFLYKLGNLGLKILKLLKKE